MGLAVQYYIHRIYSYDCADTQLRWDHTQWCILTLGPWGAGGRWTFKDGADDQGFHRVYYFRSQDDLALFQLTTG